MEPRYSFDKAIIGSTNPSKIIGARKALGLAGINNIHYVKVEGLPPQPIGFEEIVKCAIERAARALNGNKEALGVGIEAGIVSLGGYYHSGQVAVITDGEHYTVGTSMFFPIPYRMYNDIMRGGSTELKEALEKHYGLGRLSSTIGAIGYFSSGWITRIELSFQATLSALLPWLHPEYGELKILREAGYGNLKNPGKHVDD
jgi:inosine/xanthosine triphosphatase